MPANFQHKYDLVAAEKCRVLGDFTQAIELYDRAISGAKTNEFIHEEAIANEVTAKFYLEWGKKKIAAVYMQSAYYGYLRWGATAKTTQLAQIYPQLLAPIFQAQQAEFSPLSTIVSSAQDLPQRRELTFDLASVIQSAQALSSTIDLEVLIQQLSQIILQNSGAETCILALPDPQGEWQIRQSSLTEKELMTTQVSQTIVDSTEYPANLIYWIKNTQQSIIFDARQPLEITDLYLLEHQPQSVFCLPIVKQQQVLGVLYLEHRHAPAIFTANTRTVISFLCTQAAIALDNANLYRESQQAAADIRLKQRHLETLLSDRQGMEVALRKSEERYHQMVSNVPGTLYQFALKPDGSYQLNYVSARFSELFEVAAEAVVADIDVLLNQIVLADRQSFDRSISRATRLGKSWAWEGRILTPSGKIKWIRGESRPQLDAHGAIVWDGILVDITERQAALEERNQTQIELSLTNERLELTIQELQQATRLKDEFLATMSHELRTPLNAILGMSESLQAEIFGQLKPRQLNAISTIEQSGEHLLSLITDILDVSKISAGKLELQIAQVAVTELCKSSLVLVTQQAIDKQIQIDTHLPADLDSIWVDERRMCQVLINLLNNAVKFTPQGGTVVLSVWVEDRPISANWLYFSISDTGIGIDSADLSKLFQPFIQIDSSLNRKYAGTGLGLALVKQIVELHGGAVTIASEVGSGSCFTIRIPQPQIGVDRGVPTCAPAAIIAPVEDYPSTDRAIVRASQFPARSVGGTELNGQLSAAPLILLVEENEVNINTFSSYLSAKGYRIVLAQTGRAAIALTHSHQPALILMAMQLPDLDGITAIEWIRQQPYPRMPIIVLTAVAMDGEREKCLAAGADRYLTKPVKLRELHHAIQDLLNVI